MIKRIRKEISYFRSFSRNMRYLLTANLIYAFVLPVVEIFVGAYIIGESQDNTLFVKYQLAVYTGIPLTFLINGYLLRRIRIVQLYSLGLLLSGVSMAVMMSLPDMALSGVLFAGLIMGCSYGFFWANRDYMSLDATDDNNRNYYFGLDTLFYTLTFVLVPALVGYFITFGVDSSLFRRKQAYIIVTIIVFILTIIATLIIKRTSFKNPRLVKFIYFKFDILWRKMLVLAVSKGIMQGSILIFPTMLILSFFKTEQSLGLLTSLGGLVAAIILYLIGRYAKPEHRFIIYSISIVIFVFGIFFHSILFSTTGVIIYQILTYMSRPLHDVSYFPTEFKIIDLVSVKESRNEFSYILNHEFALYFGRILGCAIFLGIALIFNVEIALRFGLLIVGLIMFFSLFLMKNLCAIKSN